MKVLGLISSSTDPASRFRIIQYKEALAKENISLTPRYFSPPRDQDPLPWMYQFKKIAGINEWRTANTLKLVSRLPLLFQQFQYDIIWQNRLILPYYNFIEKKYKKPLIFDYDDAIWLNEGARQVKTTIAKAAMVFAGNEYLADFALKHNKNINIIPTTVDTGKLFPLNIISDNFTIGWIGSKSNTPYLDIIKPALLDFLAVSKNSRLIIVSSEKPSNFVFDNERIVFKNWYPEMENEIINQFTVGIMPLADNEYTRGKCSYKMLQYMACGKPVIVSPVGMNNKLLAEDTVGLAANTKEEWVNALTTVKNDISLSGILGTNGRKMVENNYSLNKYAPIISEHFRNISG